ncbi:MAG: hypothetical protein PWQ09_1199 [Candidatus Cloacimonadota bacterium]|nr:hypothetical protein [Candidatus Cloacimonadota bacterium]
MFKLINYSGISQAPTEFLIEDGEVTHQEQIKYQYDEENPVDKRKRIRFGKYYETDMICKFYMRYAQYKSLFNFINNSELVEDLDNGLGLYIWFTDEDDEVHGLPISQIVDLPDIEEVNRFYLGEYEMELKSIYTERPHIPNFCNYGTYGDYGADNFGY